MSFALSIIIPTHNRPQILRQCLDCIASQTVKDLEVIVVSDGPDEKTTEMFAGLTWPFEIQYFAIPKSQQGVCRNRAVEKARSKLVLLIGDDIFLGPDACERHVRIHEKQGAAAIAVLGFTTWDPSLKITPLMKWMEKSGVQFGYAKKKSGLRDFVPYITTKPRLYNYEHDFVPKAVQHWLTYTSHISLPAKILYQNQFREDVSLYGWEDIEWGKRLAEKGVRLFYEPGAKAYHHHAYTNEEVWERSRLLGVSAVKMERLLPVGARGHAPLQVVPRGLKKLAYYLCALLPTYRGKHCRAFLKGLFSA